MPTLEWHTGPPLYALIPRDSLVKNGKYVCLSGRNYSPPTRLPGDFQLFRVPSPFLRRLLRRRELVLGEPFATPAAYQTGWEVRSRKPVALSSAGVLHKQRWIFEDWIGHRSPQIRTARTTALTLNAALGYNGTSVGINVGLQAVQDPSLEVRMLVAASSDDDRERIGVAIREEIQTLFEVSEPPPRTIDGPEAADDALDFFDSRVHLDRRETDADPFGIFDSRVSLGAVPGPWRVSLSEPGERATIEVKLDPVGSGRTAVCFVASEAGKPVAYSEVALVTNDETGFKVTLTEGPPVRVDPRNYGSRSELPSR